MDYYDNYLTLEQLDSQIDQANLSTILTSKSFKLLYIFLASLLSSPFLISADERRIITEELKERIRENGGYLQHFAREPVFTLPYIIEVFSHHFLKFLVIPRLLTRLLVTDQSTTYSLYNHQISPFNQRLFLSSWALTLSKMFIYGSLNWYRLSQVFCYETIIFLIYAEHQSFLLSFLALLPLAFLRIINQIVLLVFFAY